VNHLVVLRMNLGGADAPALSRGGFEHLPSGGTALAHRLDVVPQAARAVGVLIAVFLLVAWRLHDADARPISAQLVGDDHRQAGARAGAHLRANGDDGHDPAGRYRNEEVRVGADAMRHFIGASGVSGEPTARRHKFGSDDETARGENPLQKAAAADILDIGVGWAHVTLLWQPP
jgi:hypothetical protein